MCVRVCPCVCMCVYNYTVFLCKMQIYRQLSNARIVVRSIHVHTYDNSGHGNDNGKINYVADNEMPQQMK